jgi:hypothetical protein
MAQYKDWFGVDVEKRASMVRSRPLERLLKELLANSLDAHGTDVTITCTPCLGTRRDKAGLRAFDVTCQDNGGGCEDPDILRRVGSSTSDLHPETRGRFGQGLIDVVAASEWAELRTLRHRLRFDGAGCKISTIPGDPVRGMVVKGLLRHEGDGAEYLGDYFRSVIVPKNVRLAFDGDVVAHRRPARTIDGLNLLTVAYKPEKGQWARFNRVTTVEVLPQWGDEPIIFELGIPVDRMPWSLPFDVNVLQKTPLDTERDMLPERYKRSLLTQLVPHLSDEYRRAVEDHGVPEEISGDAELANLLSDDAKRFVVRATIGVEPDLVLRRNPFDADDPSESAELEQLHGYKPVSLGHLASGVAGLLKDAPTVAKAHDEKCKAHFQYGHLPPITPRQKDCMEMYAALASAVLNRTIRCQRSQGGTVKAAFDNGTITLNIDVASLWNDPLGEESVGTILHECAHETVSGHSVSFQVEIAKLGARLAAWVAGNSSWWQQWHKRLYDDHDTTPPHGI